MFDGGSANLYSYALLESVNLIDPIGLKVNCFYSQSTGRLMCWNGDGNVVVNEDAYSGAPGHVDSTNSEHLENQGPIPRGEYEIGSHYNGPTSNTIILNPNRRTRSRINSFGRNPDSFRIHGGRRGGERTASQGCVISSPDSRQTIINESGGNLVVGP